jgi:uncharacterized protein YfbU (UPF0304 family)
MDRTLVCLITGSKYTFAKDYFNKKVEEFGDVDTLKKYFITRRVKSLISRGYSVEEIRNILNVTESNLPSPDSQDVKDIMNFYSIKKDNSKRSSPNFNSHNSDPDVAVLINNIKNLKL